MPVVSSRRTVMTVSSCEDKELLEYLSDRLVEIGESVPEMIEGFDNGVVGMAVGENKSIICPAPTSNSSGLRPSEVSKTSPFGVAL